MTTDGVRVRPLAGADLNEADRIFRLAFGTFLGMPDPAQFGGDADLVRTRWRADPSAALAAEAGGRLAGSNFLTRWGSTGFFGPLTVHPLLWDRAIGQQLLEATMGQFAAWGTGHVGLFTFAHSAKHVGLYRKFGFRPRFLTAIMSLPVGPAPAPASALLLSQLSERDRPGAIRAVAGLTGSLHPGLDVSREIEAVLRQGLGETVLVEDAAGLRAVAVCHLGAGSEAGSGACYVKFGAVRPGPGAAGWFGRLLDACASLAARRGASQLVAGVNAGCDRAWTAMAERGFRPAMQGVAMHRPNEPGYHTGDAYVIDDWR